MSNGVATSVLLRARTVIEAQIVLALLRAEGIAAFVNGTALADEFAVSQRLMGLQGVVIEVRSQDLSRARQLVDEARRTGQDVGDEAVETVPDTVGDFEPEPLNFAALAATDTAAPPAARRRWVVPMLAVLGWLVAVGSLIGWVDAVRQIDFQTAARTARLWKTVTVREGWRTDWKDTGHVSTEYRDANHNGVPELMTHYVRPGWKRSVSVDANENGLSERVDDFAAGGRCIGTWTDADENGIYERKSSLHADGSNTTSQDKDQDGISETSESHAPDGRLVGESQDSDENGIWEMSVTHYPDGTTCVWRDLDQDGMADRRELLDATGTLVRVQVDGGLKGFVDEKP